MKPPLRGQLATDFQVCDRPPKRIDKIIALYSQVMTAFKAWPFIEWLLNYGLYRSYSFGNFNPSKEKTGRGHFSLSQGCPFKINNLQWPRFHCNVVFNCRTEEQRQGSPRPLMLLRKLQVSGWLMLWSSSP